MVACIEKVFAPRQSSPSLEGPIRMDEPGAGYEHGGRSPAWLILVSLVWLGPAACANAPADDALVRDQQRVPYKPGVSIRDARLCECRECRDAACCSGEPADVPASDEELGMTVATCGGCVRRVWTVRSPDTCVASAPRECCAASVSR
jgi:hypothetical protein